MVESGLVQVFVSLVGIVLVQLILVHDLQARQLRREEAEAEEMQAPCIGGLCTIDTEFSRKLHERMKNR